MKITRTKEQIDAAEHRRKIANKGCDVCPCCGETKTRSDYITEQHQYFKGIKSLLPIRKEMGFIKIRYIHIDRYKCLTCGAEWQSEPYELI